MYVPAQSRSSSINCFSYPNWPYPNLCCCIQVHLFAFTSCPPVGAQALHSTWGWQHQPSQGWWSEGIPGSWLVSIPNRPCKGFLCSPHRLPATTIAPFKVPHTPRLGARTGLRDRVNPAPPRPGHPRQGQIGEQTSYSLLGGLVGLRAWYTAHRAAAGLAEWVFGWIPYIALQLEQKPTRMKFCPALHAGSPQTLECPVCEGTELRELHVSFIL